MKGLRKRVTVGFLSIVGLLFFSGMVSFMELSYLSRDTEDILKANSRNIELAKEMLDAVHDQNIALIHLAVFGDDEFEPMCRNSMLRLERTLEVAQGEALEKSFLDSLSFATTELRIMTDNFLTLRAAAATAAAVADSLAHTSFAADSLAARVDSLSVEMAKIIEEPVIHPDREGSRWYSEEYEQIYGRLNAAIKNYMTSTQSSLAPRAEQMKKNAYRAVTPVLISLAVMIAIVLMLYYFMLNYCVNPILRMNKGLGDYLSFRLPFAVKGECRDEVLELKEKIDSLINHAKQQKQQGL